MVAYSFIGAIAVLSSIVSAAPLPQVEIQGAPAESSSVAESVSASSSLSESISASSSESASASSSTISATISSSVGEPVMATGTPSEPWKAPQSWEPSQGWQWQTWQHGSGKASWTTPGYDECVQRCIAEHSPKKYEWKPSETKKEPVGPKGTGATHVVIVAPSQGVLRYVPYAIDAQVGDTVKFVWGANGHTVTQGSELLPCNKSSEGFVPSGLKDKDFEFTQVVNSTEPTYFFCNAPTHCQKGMFGIINPKKSSGSETSVEKMAPKMAETSEEVAMWNSWSSVETSKDAKAAAWGNAIDTSAIPEDMRTYMLQNTAYTRSFLAANPEVLGDDGKVTISGTSPLQFPEDISMSLNNAVAASSNTDASSSAAPSGTESAAPSGTPAAAENADNGAGALTSNKALIAAFVAVATFFAL